MTRQERNFIAFKRELERLIDIIGFSDMDIRIQYQPETNDDESNEGWLAKIDDDAIGDRIIAVIFRKCIRIAPKRLAAHEVAHLLVAELVNLARSRFTTEEEIYQAHERIATKMEKVLCLI